jgi:glycosyltransferase involved in cell wall biosynthesis
MKIGIDVRCLMRSRYSGVSWYTLNLLKAMLELDRVNQYLLFYNSSKKVILPQFDNNNVSYRGFHYPNKFFNLALNFFNRPAIDKLLGQTDVLFVPNLHFVSWSKKCWKVITVHDLSFLHFPQFFTVRMRLWHKLVLWRRILNQADIIIADSQSTKRDLVDLLRIPEEKVRVIYLGVDKKYQPRDKSGELVQKIKIKYNLPEKFILYLGTLEPRKNVESIIAAYNQISTDYFLVIAGASGWKVKKIYSLARNNAKIKFIDYIEEEDKPFLYNLAALFVYPSYYEGFGLPLLEAMACGCPVICGHNSSQVEVVGEAGLLVNPFNLNEIKLAMESLLSDNELRDRLIKKGLQRAKDFSWQQTAAGTIEALTV